MNTSTNFLDQFPTVDQVQNFKANCEREFASLAEQADYRMQNYLNCVDDYSWGGICDQVANEKRSSLNYAIRVLEAQIKDGGTYTENFEVYVLCDMNGKVVSEKTVSGKYGQCWIITGEAIKDEDGNTIDREVSFIGCAKKPATYEKKGYKLMKKVSTVEYYYTLKISKNGIIPKARIISEQLQEVTAIPANGVSTRMHRIAYFAAINN